jgi:hypothetical protein
MGIPPAAADFNMHTAIPCCDAQTAERYQARLRLIGRSGALVGAATTARAWLGEAAHPLAAPFRQ